MWQAGWHFTQWQHIAFSAPTHAFVIVFSLSLCSVFLHLSCFFFEYFLPFHFLCFIFFLTSFFSLSFLLSFLSASHFLSVSSSQSRLPPPLFTASNGCVEKLVERLKQHLGIFSTSCCCVRVWVRIMKCLVFLLWHIFLSSFHNDPYCADAVKMWQNTQFDRTSRICNPLHCCTYSIWAKQKKSFAAAVSGTHDVSLSKNLLYACVLLFWTTCRTSHYRIPHPASMHPQSVLHYYCSSEVLHY